MRIDLLVENTVVHNFLRIPQSTFPLLQATVKCNKGDLLLKQWRPPLQTSLNFSFWTPFEEAWKMTIDLLVHKTVFQNFLRIPLSTFPLLLSTVQMETSRSSN